MAVLDMPLIPRPARVVDAARLTRVGAELLAPRSLAAWLMLCPKGLGRRQSGPPQSACRRARGRCSDCWTGGATLGGAKQRDRHRSMS